MDVVDVTVLVLRGGVQVHVWGSGGLPSVAGGGIINMAGVFHLLGAQLVIGMTHMLMVRRRRTTVRRSSGCG